MSDQANEMNDVAPTSLSHIVGQKGVVAQQSVDPAHDVAQARLAFRIGKPTFPAGI